MDELASLYIKLIAKDEGATEAVAELGKWLLTTGESAEELAKSLSVFGGSAKTMFLAAAGAADRYGASLADLQSQQMPLDVHAQLAQKLADKWHNASRAAAELQSKIATLGQQGSGASGYYADEAAKLGTRRGFLDEAHHAGLVDQPTYQKHMASIQGEMNSLLERATDAERRYAEAIAFKNQRSVEGARIAEQEMSDVERLNTALIHLDQLRSTGDIGTEAYNRRKSSLEAQLYDITNPQSGQHGPGRDEYNAGLALQQAKAESDAQRARDSAYNRWVREQEQERADEEARKRNASKRASEADAEAKLPVYGPGRDEYNAGLALQQAKESDLAEKADRKAAHARREYYEWLNRTDTAQGASRASTAAMNAELMTTKQRLDMLMPAEERHAQNIATYTRQLQAAEITQEQFNRLQANSAGVMRSQTHGSGKQTGQMAMQGSYMAQDIATVLSMGGSGSMAMMSGMNNLSQLVMVAGVGSPVLLSLAAAAVTVGAAFVDWNSVLKTLTSTWESFFRTLDQGAGSIEQLKAAMKLQDARLQQDMNAIRIGEMDNPEQIQKQSETAGKEVDVLKAERDRIDEQLAKQRALIGQGVGGDIEGAARKAEQEMRARTQPAGGTVFEPEYSPEQEAAIKQAGNRAAAMEAQRINGLAAEAIAKDEGIKANTERRDKIDADIKSKEAEKAALDNRLPDAMQEAHRKQGEAEEQKAREKVRKMEEDAWKPGGASSLADKAKESMKTFAEAMGNAGYDPETQAIFNAQYAGSQEGMLQEEIDKLNKQNESKIGAQMMGYSQFGQSFQMSLLKPEDEAKKQRKEQIKHLEATVAELRGIRGEINGGLAP